MKDTVSRKPLTAFHLKLIALATMIVDHVGAALDIIPRVPYNLMRSIGRIAFPLYAFLIAEGCRYTRSRERYLLRLGLLALISEIPFDLAFYNWGISFLDSTNIFYTLFFAVACIHIYETLRSRPRKIRLLGLASLVAFILIFAGMVPFAQNKGPFLLLCLLYLAGMLALCAWLSRKVPVVEDKPGWSANILALLPLWPILFLSEIIGCDYDYVGVVLIILIYLAKTRPLQVGVLALGILYQYGWDGGLQLSMLRWGMVPTLTGARMLCFALLAVVPVCFYNGKRGRDIKWPFYWSYPAHIAILVIIKHFIPI